MKVEVYFNLTRRLWSVRDAATKRVIGHAGAVTLDDVSFKVSEAGRQRVLKSQQKNVHAFVCGTLQGATWINRLDDAACKPHGWSINDAINMECARMCTEEGQRITYNPYKWPLFMRGIDIRWPYVPTPTRKARAAYLSAGSRQVWCFQPE